MSKSRRNTIDPSDNIETMAKKVRVSEIAVSAPRHFAERFSEREASRRRRPAFFNLLQIQMPVGALTSITHRVSGIFLALGVPFGIYLLDLSLQGPQSYARVVSLFDTLAFRMAAIVFVWALAHHVFAGTRHLLSDVDIGSQLHASRRSAWIVNLGGVAVALLAAGALL